MSEEIELPNGWEEERLGDFVFYQKGKKPKLVSKLQNEKCTLPYVNIKAFEKKIIDEYTDGVGCVLCSDNDFLMVWDGARSGYVGKAIKGALGSTLVKIQFPGIYIEYAYLFLQSKYLQINTNARGTGIPHVDPSLLWNYRFPIPPLPEQHRIVDKIEELFSDLDNGIENLKTAQKQLKTYRQAVLKWAFEGKLTNENAKDGELPKGDALSLLKGWKRVKLERIADLCLGKMLDERKNKGTLKPYLGNINVRWGKFDLYNLKNMKFEDSETERYSLQIGDLVVCEGGEPGRCAIWTSNETIYIQKALHRVRLLKGYSSKYLYYVMLFYAATGKLEYYFTGTTIKHLTGRSLKKIEFIFPSTLSEQQAIVAEIESRLSVCDKLEESIEQSLVQAEALRQSILKKAFEGKLVPQDPNDEPASILLKRIRAEQANSTTVKKSKTPKRKNK